MAHPKLDLYREERRKGMTVREIALKYGVTTQAVYAATGKSGDFTFRGWSKKRCVYPNVRKWLTDNEISLCEFMRRMDITPSGTNAGRIGNILKGKGYPRKETIDKMLEVTGLSYEQFWEVDDG